MECNDCHEEIEGEIYCRLCYNKIITQNINKMYEIEGLSKIKKIVDEILSKFTNKKIDSSNDLLAGCYDDEESLNI